MKDVLFFSKSECDWHGLYAAKSTDVQFVTVDVLIDLTNEHLILINTHYTCIGGRVCSQCGRTTRDLWRTRGAWHKWSTSSSSRSPAPPPPCTASGTAWARTSAASCPTSWRRAGAGGWRGSQASTRLASTGLRGGQA